MPIIKSAQKALRQSLRRRARNRRRQETARELTRKFRRLVAAQKIDEAASLTPRLYQALDKAAKLGRVLKRGTAARKKSRLMALLSKARALLPA